MLNQPREFVQNAPRLSIGAAATTAIQGSVRYGQLMPDRSVEVHPGVSIFCLASANEQPQNVLGKLKPEPPQLWHTSNFFAKAPPGHSPTGVGGDAAGGVPVVPVE